MIRGHVYHTIICAALLITAAASAVPAYAQSPGFKSLNLKLGGMPADSQPAAPADTVTARPQSKNVNAAIMPDSAAVGDPISLGISIRIPKGAKIIPPETGDGFGDFTVLSWDNAAKPGKDGDTAVYRYSLASFKPENCTIPQLRFFMMTGGDTLPDTLYTAAIPVKMISVIPPDTPDSALTIKDLKAQQKAGSASFQSLWLLLVVALAAVIYYWFERRAKRRAGIAAPAAPLKPPYEEAIELIEALEKKNMLMRGEVREYVFELSEIFKRYIGRRYDTIAPELTTEEIVAWLEFSDISREMRHCAGWFFYTSDRVKYAKWVPNSQTLNRFMKEVRTFLEATKPGTELQYEIRTQRMGAVQ